MSAGVAPKPAGRDHRRHYANRKAAAIAAGYPSYWAMRKARWGDERQAKAAARRADRERGAA